MWMRQQKHEFIVFYNWYKQIFRSCVFFHNLQTFPEPTPIFEILSLNLYFFIRLNQNLPELMVEKCNCLPRANRFSWTQLILKIPLIVVILFKSKTNGGEGHISCLETAIYNLWPYVSHQYSYWNLLITSENLRLVIL